MFVALFIRLTYFVKFYWTMFQLRELYAVALESDVVDCEGYKESLELLG